jgi:cardiolipin synthase (CMP-forming)
MKITANQVTLCRIILLPVPVYLIIYQPQKYFVLAFILFIILGITDFIDGYMARKVGPTALGTLLDPIADKLFLVACFYSLNSLGYCPTWVMNVVFLREFLITSLRSSIAYRNEKFKTSILGKLKTIVQMGGLGTIVLTILLGVEYFMYTTGFFSIFLILVALYQKIKIKDVQFWILPVSLSLFILCLGSKFSSENTLIQLQLYIIIFITWVSGLSYVVDSYKVFMKTGLYYYDMIRLSWVFTFSIGIIYISSINDTLFITSMFVVAAELASGGVDNYVAFKNKTPPFANFILNSIAGIIFLLILNFVPRILSLEFLLTPFCVLICLISLLSFSVYFFVYREIFWEDI